MAQDAIIYIDANSKANLQNQIRQKLVDGILNGTFPPGKKLPSSRRMAEQIKVARNTVVLAYQQLIAEGYLVSRQRSGIFVNQEILASRVGHSLDGASSRAAESAIWRKRVRNREGTAEKSGDLPNWKQFPYPFIDGKFDESLFPIAEWREANRLALSVGDVADWSTGGAGGDDPLLIEQIRTKILTRRGIQAQANQILITMGTQHSLYMISELLVDRTIRATMEDPGNAEMRTLLQQRGASIVPQPVDDGGMVVDEALHCCDIVYVSPSHQIPTAVAMSLDRREALIAAAVEHDFLIVEDDYECEVNYLDHPLPALRSIDTTGRVVYVASFSKVLAPGLRLGFIVANAEFIRRARQLRRKILNYPSLMNQRTIAHFLALGHYDALMLRLGRVLRERRMALRDALNYMRGIPMEISPVVGGTTYWVRTPKEFNIKSLASEAEKLGILIEPVEHYYANSSDSENCFRMGVTSITEDRIRPGVKRLVELIRQQVKGQVEQLGQGSGEWLTGNSLREAMAGATFLYREVYGAPCTIQLHADGKMTGVLGFANEETDTGRWWVDGEHWYRRWKNWVYGEATAYYVVIDGDRIKWFNKDRQIVDSAFIRPAQA